MVIGPFKHPSHCFSTQHSLPLFLIHCYVINHTLLLTCLISTLCVSVDHFMLKKAVSKEQPLFSMCLPRIHQFHSLHLCPTFPPHFLPHNFQPFHSRFLHIYMRRFKMMMLHLKLLFFRQKRKLYQYTF